MIGAVGMALVLCLRSRDWTIGPLGSANLGF